MPDALLVAEFESLNGGERSLLSVLPHLRDHGWQFQTLVTAHGPLFEALTVLKIPVVPWRMRERGGRRLPLEELRKQVADAIVQFRPDLVHANSLAVSRIAGPLSKQFCEVAFLGYLRDIMRLNRRNAADLNQLHRIVAVSNAVRDFHIGQGLEPSRVVTIYNGIDADHFIASSRNRASQNGIRSELGIPDSSPLVLFVGQIGLRKGLEVWMAAAEQIARGIPDARFLIVGARHSMKEESVVYERRLREASESGCLAGRVHWIGNRDDVAALMEESAVLLHTPWQEPLGRVLLEGLAIGLPMVATDVGGTAEIFRGPLLQSLLVPPGDFAAAARRVTELLSADSHRDEIRRTMKCVAGERFTAQRAAGELLDLYNRLLAEKPGFPSARIESPSGCCEN